MITETIDLLGRRAEDRVTGQSGVITSVCFDLYGCVQVVIQPRAKPDGEMPSGHWFDIGRVKVSDESVMAAPDFDAAGVKPSGYAKGAAQKPLP